jgi:hypothetical protein
MHYLTVYADLMTKINVVLLPLFVVIYALIILPKQLIWKNRWGAILYSALDEKLAGYIT